MISHINNYLESHLVYLAYLIQLELMFLAVLMMVFYRTFHCLVDGITLKYILYNKDYEGNNIFVVVSLVTYDRLGHGPTVCKSGNLVPWSASVARVHPRTSDHR